MNFNDWDKQEIYHKDDIINYQFLLKHAFITEVDTDFYYLTNDMRNIEMVYYKEITKELAEKLNITDVEKEIKKFIAKLNLYNEIKDINDALVGKVAELKGVTIKEFQEELGIYDPEEKKM
ncbi:hypothetical protein EDEG_03144 [Edhazardia aedis USNM 41457]|uniref:Uncharacterized protein n=1 Tax=Edhazardia aedis (strain USNM 41457) TaxID=1003232 RepID=J9DIJ8_EDHAE|nr:hypothetical protein EDEG_03144 [Edhazardia aedis USNM 41457]|eukprot:EJW02440.1 hypothetical protein EDEG_03144 [Edhazardia aedis USNM 41457]